MPSLDLPGLLPPACGGPVDRSTGSDLACYPPTTLPPVVASPAGLPTWPANLACRPEQSASPCATTPACHEQPAVPPAVASRPRQWTRVDWLQYSRARRRYRDTRTQAVGLQTCACCFRMRQAAHAHDSRHGGCTGKRAARAASPTSAQLPRAAQLTGTSRAKYHYPCRASNHQRRPCPLVPSRHIDARA